MEELLRQLAAALRTVSLCAMLCCVLLCMLCCAVELRVGVLAH